MYFRGFVVHNPHFVSVFGCRIEHVSRIDDLDRLSGAELLDVLREQERIKHEAELVGLAVIAKLEARCVAFDFGAKNTVDLLRHALNIGARDASGRVRLAAAVGERATLTGVPVAPAHPQTAAALAAGAVSVRAAGTIVATVEANAAGSGRCLSRAGAGAAAP